MRTPNRSYVSNCGAHGYAAVSFAIWDADRGVEVWHGASNATLIDAGVHQALSERATTALVANTDAPIFPGEHGVEIDLTELVPSYDADGQLRVEAQFTGPTCYACSDNACSDNAWSSYTASNRQPLPTVPAFLAQWTTAPVGVQAFARAHGNLSVGGWSQQL